MFQARAVKSYKTCGLFGLLLLIGIGQAKAAELTVFDQGAVSSSWDRGVNAFDEGIEYGECNNDGGAGCPNISWEIVNDSQRGNVLQVTHNSSGMKAGIFIASTAVKNLSNFASGNILFDIKVVSGDSNITMKIDCKYPCTSGDQLLGSKGASGWETVTVPLSTLVLKGLDLSKVNTGIVVWATSLTNTVFRIDNVRWQTSGNVTNSDSAPTPTEAESEVLSIFSDVYTNVAGTNFDPNWNQSTSSTIANGELVYTNLNYQGTEFSTQNVSGYEYLHVDFYSDNSTDLGIYLIGGGNETEYEFTVTQGQWNSVDIPLTAFTGVDLTSVNQFKVEGNGSVRLDNLYFAGNSGSGNTGGGNSALTPVDADKWFHQTQLPVGGSWYNNERQHYTNRIENSHVSNGSLKIVAIKELFTDQGQTKQFTSARLNSKYAFKYGRVVVRAKLPSGVGTWPAIWTLGKNISEAGAYWQTQGFGTTTWPDCGEIDIMEHWGDNQNYVSSAMHTPSSYGGTINYHGQIINTASTAFHNYELDWNSERIIFSVDGVEHYTYAPEDKNPSTWPYDAEQYLILNIAMQDSALANFTQSAMEIDYVRIYAENASASAQPIWSDEFNTDDGVDTDGDGIDDSVDPDDDNDTYADSIDDFPLDNSEWLDTDSDGTGNNADTDDDNDNVSDSQDAFSLLASESIDTDGDGIGDNADTDDDGDGILDSLDSYPLDSTNTPIEVMDIDGNGQIDGLTDVMLVLRYVFGFSGDSLIDGLVGENATRTSAAEIEAHLESLMPTF